jgi:phenylacetate-CoA ligase
MMILAEESYQQFFEAYLGYLRSFYNGELSGEFFKNWQNQNLKSVLQYVKANSGFYQEKLKNIDISQITIDSLEMLPFTIKQDLRTVDTDILSQPVKTAGVYYETTGTTGKATPCCRNIFDVIRINNSIKAGVQRLLTEILPLTQKAIGIMGPSELHSTGDTIGNIFMEMGYCVFKIWPYSPVIGYQKTLEILKKYQIEVLLGTPGVIQTLYKACRKYGYDIVRDFNLKFMLLIGEMCTVEMQRNIENIWKVKAYNFLYGSQESGHAAVCCRNKHFHLLPLNYIYEVVEINGARKVPTGVVGEFVLTMIQDNSSKPLIRYRTGDVAVICEDRNCADIQSPIVDFKGRVKDILELNGNKCFAADIETVIMGNFDNCIGYQINIETRGNEDFVMIELEFAGMVDNEKVSQLKKTWPAKFGTECEITIIQELDAIVNLGALVSWKAARINDLRKEDSEEKLIAKRIAKNRGI